MMGGGGSNSRPLNCERSLKLEKASFLANQTKKKPSFSLAFGFGMLCLSVSAQTKPKFRYFGLNSGFGRSLISNAADGRAAGSSF